MKFTEAKENEYPVCQFCEEELDEIMYIRRRAVIYFCPYCKEILFAHEN